MPIDATKLTGTPGLPGAGNREYPPTGNECAQEWADALGACVAGIVPASTTIAAANSTLLSALQSAFALPQASKLAAFDAALLAWATTIAGGMAGFAAVPPVGSPLALLLALPTPPSTRSAGVATAANSIVTWLKTGTATMTAPPGTTVTWT